MAGGWSEEEVLAPAYRMRPKWDLKRTLNQVNSHFAQSCEWAHFRIKIFIFYNFPECNGPAASRSTTKARGYPQRSRDAAVLCKILIKNVPKKWKTIKGRNRQQFFIKIITAWSLQSLLCWPKIELRNHCFDQFGASEDISGLFGLFGRSDHIGLDRRVGGHHMGAT